MRNMGWMDEAGCRESDLNFFMRADAVGFSANKTACLAVCAGCPVRRDCLDYAFTAKEEHGIWGGKTASQRESMISGPYRDEVYPDNVFAPPLTA